MVPFNAVPSAGLHIWSSGSASGIVRKTLIPDGNMADHPCPSVPRVDGRFRRQTVVNAPLGRGDSGSSICSRRCHKLSSCRRRTKQSVSYPRPVRCAATGSRQYDVLKVVARRTVQINEHCNWRYCQRAREIASQGRSLQRHGAIKSRRAIVRRPDGNATLVIMQHVDVLRQR